VTWYEAAKFVNWLNTSTGNAPAYKFDGSGNFQLWQTTDAGYDPNNLYRNKLAKYILPTIHEWHKAAFYDPTTGAYYTYTTANNNVPDGIDFPGDPIFDAVFYDGGLNSNPNLISNVGLASSYGTLGQGGNVDEWLETADDWTNSTPGENRIRIGGSWVDDAGFLSSYGSSGAAPFVQRPYSGFRIASVVPEPASVALTLLGFGLLCPCRRNRHTSVWISTKVYRELRGC
jgi:formylglycine-generating enzyme